MTARPFSLLAIVAVDKSRSVRCQQPGCGHGVYARIHVVEDQGQLMVVGSDCFAKRYGQGDSTGFRGYGACGGRVLTEAERDMLLHNTAALLAQFEAERVKEQELAKAKLWSLRGMLTQRQAVRDMRPLVSPRPEATRYVTEPRPLTIADPLPAWAGLKKPKSSFFAYGMDDGQCWVVMESATHAGCFIAPAPEPFDGWDEALPPGVGRPDLVKGVYESDKGINVLSGWFAARQTKGSRIDSDVAAIQRYAHQVSKTI